jgi:D-ribulokinase
MAVGYLGVDVGTGSVRAGVFDARGRLLGQARRPIATWRGAGDIVEQSSDDIWTATTAVAREAVAGSGLDASAIAGVGFDATCSLVVVDAAGRPLAVGPSGEASRNVMVTFTGGWFITISAMRSVTL